MGMKSRFAIRLLILGIIATPSESFGGTVLRQLESTAPSEFVLKFDQPLLPNQIKTEFFRDIVQLSIKGASVYPARISNHEDGIVSKIFAYQYTPDLIRCRFTVRGDAREFENRIQIEQKGKEIVFRLKSVAQQKDIVTTQAAQAIKPIDEKKLLEKVIQPEVKQTPLTQNPKPKKSFYSYSKWVAGLVLFLAVILSVVLIAIRKGFRGRKGFFSKFISKITPARLAEKGPQIDIISRQHLGPKRSIAVIQVQDRQFVVGITEESINLITDLSDEMEMRAYTDITPEVKGAISAGQPMFAAPAPTPQRRYRDEVRKKVEGLKNL